MNTQVGRTELAVVTVVLLLLLLLAKWVHGAPPPGHNPLLPGANTGTALLWTSVTVQPPGLLETDPPATVCARASATLVTNGVTPLRLTWGALTRVTIYYPPGQPVPRWRFTPETR